MGDGRLRWHRDRLQHRQRSLLGQLKILEAVFRAVAPQPHTAVELPLERAPGLWQRPRHHWLVKGRVRRRRERLLMEPRPDVPPFPPGTRGVVIDGRVVVAREDGRVTRLKFSSRLGRVPPAALSHLGVAHHPLLLGPRNANGEAREPRLVIHGVGQLGVGDKRCGQWAGSQLGGGGLSCQKTRSEVGVVANLVLVGVGRRRDTRYAWGSVMATREQPSPHHICLNPHIKAGRDLGL